MALHDVVTRIHDYEMGYMSEEETIAFFQNLIDTGIAWQLQGTYARTAVALIEAGHCTKQVTSNHRR